MQPNTDAVLREKSPSALRTISEAAELLDVPQHVLRFWETKFTQIKPLKRNGGRRYYRPEDIEILLQVKHLLYKQGYTIKGAKKAFEKKTIEEIRQEFSLVGLGEPVSQDNDNHREDEHQTPDMFASAGNAASEESPTLSAIAGELRAISAELRKRKPSKK